MKDRHEQSTISAKPKESDRTIKSFNKLKTLDIDGAQGFTCDAETGVCGPVNQEKVGNK